ncbi:little elongation complex subunit 2 isoform X2 [Xenopus laevis]|nr:little elongation complex subunit 2 isoform X2 [Xenopus laevis]OCT89436.1 hypothetical protein XELAEV_18018057mg [Xenopus laevis]
MEPALPESRFSYPFFSSLTKQEQRTYVQLMIKFLSKRVNFKPQVAQQQDYDYYLFLKEKSSKENAEFLKFLHNSARSCTKDYEWLCPDADWYTQNFLKTCQAFVKNYPEFYTVNKMTSILGGKFIPDLSLTLEKCLLKMGTAPFVKLKFPASEIDLSASFSKVFKKLPPEKKATFQHASLITDPNVANLAVKYSPQVVLTSQVLYTLLNNHGPSYVNQWEIPLRVETIHKTGEKPHKIVYMDPPLPKKEVSVREKNKMFHEAPLDFLLRKKNNLLLEAIQLDKPGIWSQTLNENRPERVQQSYYVDVDFENDVTELETFGCTKNTVSASRDPESAPESAKSNSVKMSLEMEKQVIDSTKHGIIEGKILSQEDSISTTQSPSSNSDVESSFEGFMSDEVQVTNSSSFSTNTKKCAAKSKISEHSAVGFAANPSGKLDQSQSDSEDDRLVIDIDSSKNNKVIPTLRPKSPASPPSTCTKESECLPRKSNRALSKEFDPVGQILKMQKHLLKSGTKKTQEQADLNPESGHVAQQEVITPVNPSVSLVSEADHVNPVHEARHFKKSLLSKDLLAASEDETKYIAPTEGNRTYKLFSLDDMLLLIRSNVQKAYTYARSGKASRKQVPGYVLTKINYQWCYGVEILTESEICQLWTERLLHSNSMLYIGHIDVFTSKFFMLEEVTSERLDDLISNLKPVNSLNILHHILKWVSDLQEGSYLLSHTSGDSSVCLYKSISESCRRSYNLYDAHASLPKTPSTLCVPWVAVNSNLLLPYHIHHGRPPCTFPPTTDGKKVKAPVNKQKECQSNKETLAKPATDSEASEPPNKTRKKRNKGKRPARISKLRAKQRIWSAKAAK